MSTLIDAIKRHTSQPEHASITASVHLFQNTTVHPFQDDAAAIPSLQDHETFHRIKDLKNMFADSFNKIDNMSGEYSITVDPNTSSTTSSTLKQRVPIEIKEDIETQMKEMTVQDIIPQVKPTPWVSSLTYPARLMGS